MALVYDQIADGDLAQAVQGIFAVFFLFLRTADAERTGRKDRVSGKRQAAPGGKLPRQHLHQPGGARSGGIGGYLQPLGAQVGGKAGRRAGCTGHNGHGCAAAAQRLYILQQCGNLAAPGGQRVGRCVDDGLQRYVGHAARKVLRAERAVGGGLRPEPAGLGVELVQPGGECAVLHQGGELLPPAVGSGARSLPQGSRLLQNQQRIVEIVKQCGGLGIAQRQVLIHVHRHCAAVQLGQIRGGAGLKRGAPLAARLFDAAAYQGGGLGGLGKQHLACGGDIDFFNRLVPALGGQIEAVHRVDLVPPELQTGGLLHVGRVDVHNVAADRKLTRPVHLVAAGIARAVQQGGQLGPGQRVTGVQGAGVGAELGPRRCVLGQALVRHADGLQPPADQIAQHGQTAVFVLAAGALDGAQHIIARGEYRRSDAQRIQITGKAGSLGLTGGHNAERAAQRLRQRGVDQGVSCAGNAK